MIDIYDIVGQAKMAVAEGMPEKALLILNNHSNENSGEVIFLKGEIYFELQRWGESLNQFSAYLEQNPNDKQAESYIQMIQNILGFYHRDRYNP